MSKIWVLEHIDNAGIKFYWCQLQPYPGLYVADINSATIYHDETLLKNTQKSLVATKPKIISVNITPHVSNNK